MWWREPEELTPYERVARRRRRTRLRDWGLVLVALALIVAISML